MSEAEKHPGVSLLMAYSPCAMQVCAWLCVCARAWLCVCVCVCAHARVLGCVQTNLSHSVAPRCLQHPTHWVMPLFQTALSRMACAVRSKGPPSYTHMLPPKQTHPCYVQTMSMYRCTCMGFSLVFSLPTFFDTSCELQGIEGGMCRAMDEAKLAVESGYWPL